MGANICGTDCTHESRWLYYYIDIFKWMVMKLHHVYILFLWCSNLFQDKANKRWMLMSIDRRKKLLKYLRRSRYDAFEKVCAELGITYTFPPEYYRRATRRWLAKKALCIKVMYYSMRLISSSPDSVAKKWQNHTSKLF